MACAINRRSMLLGMSAAGLAVELPLPAWADSPRSDPEWVRVLLTTLHPGLCRYQSPAEFLRRHVAFADSWARHPSLENRYLALSRFLATLRCGHSYVNPYNQKKQLIAGLTGGRRLLPLRFRWIDSRMVTTADPYATGLAPGTTILSIDDVPTARILAALLPFARADGGNDAKRRSLLELNDDDEFAAFDLFHPLLFRVAPTVRLRLLGPDGRRETRSLATVSRAERLAARRPKPAKQGDAPVWTIERRGRSALLTMNDWGLYDSKWDWKGWLDEQFAALRRADTSGLVIDLRANEGGLDCGDDILARLIDRPLAPEASRRLVRFRTVARDLRAPLDTWDPGFVDLGKDAAPFGGNYFALAAADSGGSNPILPKARFDGKVAVLVSATNSSATFQFAQRIKVHRLATLVGAPTGGNRRGINGGAFFFVRLPESGLEFDLPLIGYFPQAPQPDAGILPNIAVPLTAAGLAAGRDEALDKALKVVG